ncbi:MAG: hypothetical protein AB3N14_21270, partial [Flavobacteriaceae bacterium]
MIKDLSLFLNALGAGNCFLLSYTYLLKKQPKTLKVNQLLSLLFFILGVVIVNTLVNFTGYSYLFSGFESISNALTYGIAPLLLLYVRALSAKHIKSTLWSPHLLPGYAILLITLISLAFPTTGFGQWGEALLNNNWAIGLWNLQFAVYLVLLFMELRSM